MKVTSIQVEVNMRLNLGNFEGVLNPIRISADLEETDNLLSCTELLYAKAYDAWSREMLKIIRFYRNKSTSKDQFDTVATPLVTELKKFIKTSI